MPRLPFLRQRPILLVTSWDAATCTQKLKAALSSASLLAILIGVSDPFPVVGSVSGAKFRIQKRQPFRNVFAPCFYGTLQAAPGGTEIEGHFGMHPVITGIVLFWLVVGIILSVRNLIGWQGVIHSFWDFPLAPLVGLVVLVGLGKLLSLNDEEYLIGFLQRTLAAR